MKVTKSTKYIILFYHALHFVHLFRMFLQLDNLPLFPAITLISIIPIILGLRNILNNKLPKDSLFWWIVIYLVFSITSFLCYYYPNNPSHPMAYIYGVYYFILPMFCYFCTLHLNNYNKVLLLKTVIILNCFMLATSVLLFYIKPTFYTHYLVNTVLVHLNETDLSYFYYRLQGYFGSTAVGAVAATTIPLITFLKIKSKYKYLIVLFCIFATILTYQRAAVFSGLVGLLSFVFITKENLSKKFVSIICLLTAFSYIFLVWKIQEHENSTKYYTRFTQDLTEMFEGRGYSVTGKYFLNFPLGVGLGGASSAADSYGYCSWGQVVDANYMRILVELGIIGLLIFVCILFSVIKNAVKNQQLNVLCSILIICIIMVGTNTLDSYYVSHCFWLFVGITNIKSNKPIKSTIC